MLKGPNCLIACLLPSSTFTSTYDLFIFSENSAGAFQSGWAAYVKLRYFKIWSGSTLVRDYIPVRVGQVGYLYDKVNKTLYGNVGSGSFTYGNDIKILK